MECVALHQTFCNHKQSRGDFIQIGMMEIVSSMNQ